MNARRALFLLVTFLMPAVLSGQQNQPSADLQLKAAIQSELVDGDLRAAVDAYKAIVVRFGDNHAVAAKALLQLAGCYEKLGQADARKTYEQLVRDYADQAEAVGQARARLAALGGTDHSAVPAAPVALPRVDVVNDIRAVSPDGTKALFISYDTGQNLAVYDFATRQAKLVTQFDWTTAWVYYGAWSPDGRRVAYMQSGFAPTDIKELRVATLDGTPRVIFRNEANPGRPVEPAAWTPDGQKLIVVLGRADGTSAIGLVPVAGGPFTSLRSLPWAGKVSRPRVSPDGRFVAFAEGALGARDIRVLSLDGSAAYQITDHPADDFQPLWSPDGRHLIFISTRFGGAALWAVAMKDGQRTGDPVRVRDGFQGVELIDWTTRGLTYVDNVQTYDIYTAAIDRSTWQPTGESRALSYPRTGRNTAPVWSPDGRNLAFVSGSLAEPDRRYLVIVPEGGGDPREYLIPTARYAYAQEPYDLRWFGDGSGLGFSGIDRQGQQTVFHLTLATGQWRTEPAPGKTWNRLEWNADGTKYFYTRQALSGAPPAIIERDLANSSERVIFEPPHDKQVVFRGLRLSPDRKSLAFTTMSFDDRPDLSLVVADVETGRARVFMEETGGATYETGVSFSVPAWSPDGRAVIVPHTVGPGGWPQELRVVPIDGGSTRSLALNKSLAGRSLSGSANRDLGIRDVSWSPDGMRMVFVLSEFRTDAWTIENVLAGVVATGAPRR